MLEENENLTITRGVISLQNGVLFLRQKNCGQEQFSYLCGHKKISDDSIYKFNRNIEFNVSYSLKNKIQYQHIIFPAKAIAYREQLNLVGVNVSPIYSRQCHTHYSVFYPDIKSLKTHFYIQDDSHCSFLGSRYIIGNALKSIGIDVLKFTYALRTMARQGDLSAMLLLSPNKVVSLDYFDGFESSGYMYSLKPALQKNSGEIIFNMNVKAPIKKRLMLFGDSFFVGAVSWLRFLFEEIIYVRSPYIIEDIANIISPDVILTGNAERYLVNVPSAEKHIPFFINYICHKYDSSKLEIESVDAFQSLFSGRYSNKYNKWKKTHTLNDIILLSDTEIITKMKGCSLLVDSIRDFAVERESDNLPLAFRLMTLCKKVRPKGPRITAKLRQYKLKIESYSSI